MEALKEAHQHSTNSARLWEKISKLDKIGQTSLLTANSNQIKNSGRQL
jgi:hypothetical protein